MKTISLKGLIWSIKWQPFRIHFVNLSLTSVAMLDFAKLHFWQPARNWKSISVLLRVPVHMHIKFPEFPVFVDWTVRRGRYHAGNKLIESGSNVCSTGIPYNVRSAIKNAGRTHVRIKFPVIPDCGLRATTWEPPWEPYDIIKEHSMCLCVRGP